MDRNYNHLLASLSATETRLQLEPHLKTIELGQGEVLAEPLEQMHRVYFPYSALVSFLVPLKDGHLVQTGMMGHDGVVGAIQAIEGKVSLSRSVVRVPGRGAAIEADRLAEIASVSPNVRSLLSEIASVSPNVRSLLSAHEQFFLAEVQQSAACNAVHTVRQRVCRWMLRMNDLIGMNVAITQELLAEMIGVMRTSVTAAAVSLRDAGVIRYRRGHVQIVDIELLKQFSCECYDAVREHYDRTVNQPPSCGLKARRTR